MATHRGFSVPTRWRPTIFFVVAISIFFTFAPTAIAEAGDEAQESTSTGVTEDTERPWTSGDVVGDARMEEPSRDDLEDDEAAELSALMSDALEAEEEGHYEEAQDKFSRAYAIFPHSNLLLSVARVSAKAEEPETALQGYQYFLERRQDYENREAVEQRIEELEREIANQEEAQRQAAKEAAEEQPSVQRTSRRDDRMPSALGWAGVGAATVGLTAMIVGGRIASSVDDDFQTLEQLAADGDQQGYDELATDIESSQSKGKFFLYSGLGLSVAGAALIAYDQLYLAGSTTPSSATDEAHSRLRIESLGTEGAVLRWTRSF